MSYIQFQQQCADCKKTWNAAFGIVGTMQIAAPPKVCPYCKSPNIEHYSHGWEVNQARKDAGLETIADALSLLQRGNGQA